MNYRVLTVAREYGSGGAEIAGVVAKRLGWRLLDDALITEISRRAHVPVSDAVALDEKVDPWLHRITRPLWGTGADGASAILPVDVFDADAEAGWARRLIEEAGRLGNCVIVGRGAQCALRGAPGVFHAFVYARWSDRVRRVQSRVQPGTKINELLLAMDEQRIEYVRRHYGENRMDPHLYNLMIDSGDRPSVAAALILAALQSTNL